jgi:hypothetical protein
VERFEGAVNPWGNLMMTNCLNVSSSMFALPVLGKTKLSHCTEARLDGVMFSPVVESTITCVVIEVASTDPCKYGISPPNCASATIPPRAAMPLMKFLRENSSLVQTFFLEDGTDTGEVELPTDVRGFASLLTLSDWFLTFLSAVSPGSIKNKIALDFESTALQLLRVNWKDFLSSA